MSNPTLAQILWVGFPFAPRGYGKCDGQTLGIAQHDALYSLIGTVYGGDGHVTFALPDMRGRAPLFYQSDDYDLGQKGGAEQVSLTAAQIPAHTHQLQASSHPGLFLVPNAGRYFGTPPVPLYGPPTDLTPLSGAAIGAVGGDLPHDNMQPYLVINAVIAMYGIYPSRH